MNNKKILAPELRFKGFDGEWKKIIFTECCDLIHGFQFREEHFESSGLPVVKIGSLVDNGSISFHNATYVSKDCEQTHSKFILKKGDVLMALTGGTLGKVSRIDKDYGVIFQNYRVGKFENHSNSLKEYIYFVLQSKPIQGRLKSLVNEAAQPNFGKQDFDKIRFALPKLPEQQKIASFLSVVDEKIQQLNRKKELLEQYKKGVMQQLFSGKLRFKDESGKAFPKWEEKRLGDVCEIKGRIGYRGYTVQDIVKEGEGAITLSPSNIKDGQLSFNNSTYISWFKYEESPEIKIEVNDILLVKTGSTVGKSAFVKSLNQPATINPQLVVLKKISAAIDPHYLAYLVFHSTVQKQIVAAVGGGAVPNMSQESISGFLLPCPIRLEQQKISDYLSNIDNKIESVDKQISQTQTFKKGLLQQMFI